jgi:hypothetical protein
MLHRGKTRRNIFKARRGHLIAGFIGGIIPALAPMEGVGLPALGAHRRLEVSVLIAWLIA